VRWSVADWADGEAQEWLNEHSDAWHNVFVGDEEASASLAVLLRGVFERAYQDGRESTLEEPHILSGPGKLLL